MTLRDLTETQRKVLMKKCTEMFEMRNKSRKTPLDILDYRMAFSDGVLQAIKLLLPSK